MSEAGQKTANSLRFQEFPKTFSLLNFFELLWKGFEELLKHTQLMKWNGELAVLTHTSGNIGSYMIW